MSNLYVKNTYMFNTANANGYNTMRCTFIVKNLTEQAIADTMALPSRDAYAKFFKWAVGDLKHCVSVKYGASDAFRDRVEWNTVMKSERAIAHKIEPRKGYRLVTFETV